MITKIVYLFLALVLVSSCQVPPRKQRSLREWIGYHADDLVYTWGPPFSDYQFQNGDKVFQYVDTDINTFDSTTSGLIRCNHFGSCFSNWDFSPYTVMQLHCTTRFTITPDNRVKEVAQEGNCHYFRMKMPPVAPAMPREQSANQPPLANKSKNRSCREYSSTVIINGKLQKAYGTKCQNPDGSWTAAN